MPNLSKDITAEHHGEAATGNASGLRAHRCHLPERPQRYTSGSGSHLFMDGDTTLSLNLGRLSHCKIAGNIMWLRS